VADERRAIVELEDRGAGGQYRCEVILRAGEGACVIGSARSAELALPRAGYLDVAQEQCRLLLRGDEIMVENRSPITRCSIDDQPLGMVSIGFGEHVLTLGEHVFDLVLRRE
jgi:hypothetical protein